MSSLLQPLHLLLMMFAGWGQPDSVYGQNGQLRAYYGALERGKKNLQLTTLERVCDGLEVPMWEVIREAETK